MRKTLAWLVSALLPLSCGRDYQTQPSAGGARAALVDPPVEEVFGYINGDIDDGLWSVRLDPLDDNQLSYMAKTQAVVFRSGHPHWGWFGINPPYDGPCKIDSTANGTEIHGGSGAERHCIKPGRFRYTLLSDSDTVESRVIDWAGFPPQSDGFIVNTADPTGQLPDQLEVDNIMIYDPRGSSVVSAPLNPSIRVECAASSAGPWGACSSPGSPSGNWVRVSSWNTALTYSPPGPVHSEQALLVRFIIAGETASIRTGFTWVGDPRSPTARARELPSGCYYVQAIFHQPASADTVSYTFTASVGDGAGCWVYTPTPPDTSSPATGGSGGGGGSGSECPPNCMTARAPLGPSSSRLTGDPTARTP